MRSYPLFEAFPRLGVFPTAGLLSASTPVQVLADAQDIWIKRDDLTATDYGGNKIRKLDLLLAKAQADGKRELVTFGYSGSNFVAATAWHGRKLGLHTQAFLLPQAHASYIADNLAIGLHCGAELQVAPTEMQVARSAVIASLRTLLRQRRWPHWIPPGGSTPLGALGFVNAAFELRAQIDAGELPTPERIVVAFSSMGTVAGLSIGLALAGLPTRIEAVQVVDSSFASDEKLNRLIARTLALLRKIDPASVPANTAPVHIRRDYFGAGYAVAPTSTHVSMQRFDQASGARSDSAYSGKAIACLYDDHDAGRLRGPTLYWHTFNAHGRPDGVAALSAEACSRFVLRPQ